VKAARGQLMTLGAAAAAQVRLIVWCGGFVRVILARRSVSPVAAAREDRPTTMDAPPKVRFALDSALEESGFEPSVPRKAPGVVVVSVPVRAEFSVDGEYQAG
jgi:hypothetical protein